MHIGKLHKVGNLKYAVELVVSNVCLLILFYFLHDLRRRHFNGIDAESAVNIHTQDVGEFCVIFFFLTILPQIARL